MTLEEINELEKELDQTREKLEDYKKALLEQEMKDKQHKSLSDYRCYEELHRDCEYKFINFGGEIEEDNWWGSEDEKRELSLGNIYSIDTPNELLEREIKKRQLWFALEKHLKEKGCLATNEDWKYRCADKYCVDYDLSDESFYIEVGTVIKCNNIYSTNEETLKDYMNTLTEEDIKIMFNVE